jgi:hypothetical protein
VSGPPGEAVIIGVVDSLEARGKSPPLIRLKVLKERIKAVMYLEASGDGIFGAVWV